MSLKIIEGPLQIYTDGSSYSKPRTGGVGIRYIWAGGNGEETIEDFEVSGYKGATNNQMELQSCIIALKEVIKKFELTSVEEIFIFTDSLYVSENYPKAKFQWPKTKWLTRYGSPVENVKLWKELIKLVGKINRPVKIKWVKGHKGNEHNKAVDKLAKQSAKKPLLNRPLEITHVRRKLTHKSVCRGSVVMCGQRISIRIIECKYLRAHKTNKYKYEVLSKGSQYYKNVDIAYSDGTLKAGHSYIVTFNKNSKNPKILSVISEIQ